MKRNIFNSFVLIIIFITSCIVSNASSEVTENNNIKYAIYSGSFDPPTLAHKEIILQVLKQTGVKKLYIIVNSYNQKTFKASVEERMKMLELMLEEVKENIVIIAQDSPNKKSDYLMLKKIINEPLMLICGEDSYRRSLKIPDSQRVKFNSVLIIPRYSPEDTKEDKLTLEPNAKYLSINVDFLKISSTQIRNHLKNKEYNNIQLDKKVLAFITKNNLYVLDTSTENIRRKNFESKFYEFIGRLVVGIKPPAFEPLTSEEAWKDQFY
ncbi:MAG TPA: hypothetical protein VNJ29_03975, partial [Candidatus Nitrosotenuis sp.]|nr:hypothetical protein [Candidatus Nitrosotenuis sp.]